MGDCSVIYLVSCVGRKRAEPCAARDLYTSDWFLKARRYVESFDQPWFVLSAEHGLIAPDAITAPYERTLNTMKSVERRAWADRVLRQFEAVSPGIKRIVFIAGARYRERLEEHFINKGIDVSAPMRGLTIGRQLQWLGQKTTG